MLKTGLIQPETIPGHFPRNLRTIVELYRSCVDGGAELVLCPPLALSGAHTGELALRSGFRSQHKAALAYLAREIADVPLLLAAADADGSRFHMLRNGLSFPRQAVISPAAHGTEAVPVFGICRTADEAGFSIISWPESSPASSSVPCLLLRTHSGAWHEGLLEQDEEEACRLARETRLPVLTARLAGGEGPFLLPGASSAWSAHGILLKRLRLFERDSAVISPENSMEASSPLPAPEEQLRHALRKGTADFILKSGHGAACLNLLESSASLLLAQLLKEELPSLPLTGFIPRLPGIPEQDTARAQACADKLGIQARMLPLPADAAAGGPDDLFTAAWLMRQWTQEEGALLLSALTGTDIVLIDELFGVGADVPAAQEARLVGELRLKVALEHHVVLERIVEHKAVLVTVLRDVAHAHHAALADGRMGDRSEAAGSECGGGAGAGLAERSHPDPRHLAGQPRRI